ncbi:MAG: CHRD domain-containing protein [Ilumatobacteraceae bacterium]
MIQPPPPRQRRRLGLIVGASTLAAVTLLGTPIASAAATSQSTVTLGATQTGDPDGTGSAEVQFDTVTGVICSDLVTTNISAPTAAHIHRGVAGSTGPVVVTLDLANGCTDNDPALVRSIVDAPSDFYINVHNTDYPNGAIRGQVAVTVATVVMSTRFDLLPTGDPDGSGSVDLVIYPNEVCYDLTVVTDETVTLAHIHAGGVGVDGPVVVNFDYPTNGSTGCVSAAPATVDEIVANPILFYVNVHTVENPSGAVRNQIAPLTAQRSSTTSLDGLGFGDPDGRGDATFTFYDNGDVCYRLAVTDIATPTAAHIHTGANGVLGPVLIGLPIGETGLRGCTRSTTANLDAIRANPSGFYVNVHNVDYPNGAIRSQLAATTPATTTEFTVALAPSGDADGSGTAKLDIDGATGRVCYELTTSGISAITVAHIHQGGVGQDGPVVVDFNVPANGTKGCVFADPMVTASIVANPAGFYVNVHTTEYPNGAIRAQVNATAPITTTTAATTTTTTATPTTTTATPTTVQPGGLTPTTTPIVQRLPDTGTDNGAMALIAIALVGAGLALVGATRRRSETV